MRINSLKCFIVGVVIVTTSMFSDGWFNQKPLTENQLFGLLGWFFVIASTCIENDKK